MTNAEVTSIQPGNVVKQYINGQVTRYEVKEIAYAGTCVNERSGAFGHAYAGLRCSLDDTALWCFSIESDEFIRGRGYPTHDKDGGRIRGYELERNAG